LLCIFDFFNILSRIVIMAVMYCSDCGAKLHYEVSKPKFCSECGATISGAKTSAKKEESEEAEAEGSFQGINKLDYEISASEAGKFTLGGIIGTNEGGRVEGRLPPKNRSDDPLADSIKECSPRGKRNK
jgi:predicted RNA-binding Zn-ribbon protein involved in translation (DUF1610 family)